MKTQPEPVPMDEAAAAFRAEVQAKDTLGMSARWLDQMAAIFKRGWCEGQLSLLREQARNAERQRQSHLPPSQTPIK